MKPHSKPPLKRIIGYTKHDLWLSMCAQNVANILPQHVRARGHFVLDDETEVNPD